MKSRLIAGSVVLLAIAFGVVYKYYNKEHRTVDDEKAIVLDAVALMQEFETNETEANAKYLDHVLEVDGVVGNVTSNQEGKTILILKTNNPMAGIACTLEESTVNVKPDETIKIKGICKGYLMDVILTQAKIIQH